MTDYQTVSRATPEFIAINGPPTTIQYDRYVPSNQRGNASSVEHYLSLPININGINRD